MVQFLLKRLLKQNSRCAPRFPLFASCYKIIDSQISFTSCEWVRVGNPMGVGNFWKVGVGVTHFTSDSATLVPALKIRKMNLTQYSIPKSPEWKLTYMIKWQDFILWKQDVGGGLCKHFIYNWHGSYPELRYLQARLSEQYTGKLHKLHTKQWQMDFRKYTDCVEKAFSRIILRSRKLEFNARGQTMAHVFCASKCKIALRPLAKAKNPCVVMATVHAKKVYVVCLNKACALVPVDLRKYRFWVKFSLFSNKHAEICWEYLAKEK